MSTCKNCFHCKVGCAYMASDCDTEEVLELCAKGKQDEVPNIEDLCEDFVDKDNVFIPPVKVGQTVFLVKNLLIIKTTVEKVIMKQNGFYMKLSCNLAYETSCNSIGKTIFLDIKDAEEKVSKNEKS